MFLSNISKEDNNDSTFKAICRKNYLALISWAEKSQTNCFRLYDQEEKTYPLIIDYYAGKLCIHFVARTKDEQLIPSDLKEEVSRVFFDLLAIPSHNIFWRIRTKSKPSRQYEKIDSSKNFFLVSEYGALFKINLNDYLDTGLFLDHRETRQLVARLAKNKRLLNLFSYTSSFSVQAAKQGALFTKSVDMSNTYCAWSKENFTSNSLSLKNNLIIRDDCLKFLDKEINAKNKYDVIVIDPPTISRSKKMARMFDIQKEYIFLIHSALQLLSKEGTLLFSTNSRKFHLDLAFFPEFFFKEISFETIPADFKDKNIHRCWQIKKL